MDRDPLVDFLKTRSRRRFSRLVKQTHRQVLDAAYRVSGNRHLAEDVTQEVFLKLLTVRWDPDKVRSGTALLASTAVLTALMRVRTEDRRAARERKAALRHDRDRPAASVDDILDLREAILGLPEALQACIRLRYYGGLSSEDIAADLGCSPSAVRERLAKAREMLHRRLRPGSWLLLLPAFAEEASAGLPSVEPSPALLENLSRIGRDGPPMAAIAACGGATGVATKVAVAVAAVLVAAGIGTWAAWPWLAPGDATGAIGGGRKDVVPSASQQRADAPPSDAHPLPGKVVVRLEGDGEGWPPAAITVTVTGPDFQTMLRSENAAPAEVLLAPGSYSIEADGRPYWSREVAQVTVAGGGVDPQSVTLTLQDFYDLEGLVMSPEGRGIRSVLHLSDPFGTDTLFNPVTGSPSTGESGEFRLRLGFKDRYELVVYDARNELLPGRAYLANPEGSRRIRQEIVLERLAPIRGVILGCDGPPAGVVLISFHEPELSPMGVGGRIEDPARGAFVLHQYTKDHPFALQVECDGYAPAQVLLDPANLPEPLVIRLDCSETFYGRVVPQQPLTTRWSLSMEGSDLRSRDWQADEDGAFTVHGKDLRKTSLLIRGMGFEDLEVDLGQPSSPENRAILRPVAIPRARVRVAVEGDAALVAGASVTLQPVRQQFFAHFMEAREAPLAGSAAIFEDAIPGRYDVSVASRDDGKLARLENQEVRGPLVAISIPLPRQGVKIELRGARALGESPLTLRLDGEKEDRPFPRGGGTMDLPVLPGWHLVELRLGGTEVIYRGHLHLEDDPATVLDLARLVAIDVVRNSADAPLALRVSVFSREDPWKQAEVAFPLSDGRERSTIHWLMEPGTHPTVNGQYGYYYPHGEAGRKLEIGLGRLEKLRIQVGEGASRGRAFLIGKIPDQDMIYLWGSQRPAPSGSTFEVPVECKLSAWALLQYEGRILTGAIVEDAPLRRGTCRVRVVRSNGWPIAGAEVSVRAKEIIGLDLQRYFEANDARSLFFTLGRGTTDESGTVEVPIAEFPAMDLKATSGGRTVTADIQPGQQEILVEVRDA